MFPVPPFAEVTLAVMLVNNPAIVAMTLTLKVHEVPAAKVAPARLMFPLPAGAVMVPPPQTPVSPFGEATSKPAGRTSRKLTLVTGCVRFELLIVKLSTTEPPTGIDKIGPNDLLIVGGETTASTTVNKAEEVFPAPPLEDVAVTLLLMAPGSVPVTFTWNVQKELAGNVAPVRETLPDPGRAVIVPPPHVPVSALLGVDTISPKPTGKVSLNATLDSGTPFGLLIVKVKVVVPPTPIEAAPKVLAIVGGEVIGATPATLRLVVEVFPLPPFVDPTVTLLLIVPIIVPVTLMENVQEVPPARVAPPRDTLPEPGTAVIVPPPQVPVRPLRGVVTISPPRNASVKATPVSEPEFGLLIVKVKVVVPPTPMVAAPKDLVIVGGAMKLALQSVSETMLLSKVTAPVVAKALPDKLAPVFNVILVAARMFP